jgi:hypothetical protein
VKHVYYDGEYHYVIATSVPEAMALLAKSSDTKPGDRELISAPEEWTVMLDTAKLNIEGEVHTAEEWCKLREPGILCWED